MSPGPTMYVGRTTIARSPNVSCDLVLAACLRDAVGLRAILRIGDLEMRCDRFVETALEVRVVHTRRRREEIASRRVLEQLRRLAHPLRIRCRIVDDGVPFLADERLEVAIAIAREPYDFVRQIRLTTSAREDRDAMAARNRVTHEMRTDEPRSAKDEQSERRSCTPCVETRRGFCAARECLGQAPLRRARCSSSGSLVWSSSSAPSGDAVATVRRQRAP